MSKIISNILLICGIVTPLVVILYLNLFVANNPTLSGQINASSYIFMLSLGCTGIFSLSLMFRLYALFSNAKTRTIIEMILTLLTVTSIGVSLYYLSFYF